MEEFFLSNIIKQKKDLFYVFLLSLVIFFVYSMFLTVPKYFTFGESIDFWSYFNQTVVKNFFNFHQIGLWDNRAGLGYPLISNLSSQFYLPTIIFFFIADSLIAIKLTILLHLILGGISFYYLLKVFKLKSFVSLVGSIIFISNFYVIDTVCNGFLSETYNLVWMPLTIAFLWQALFSKKNIFILFSAIALSMHIYSMAIYSIYFTNTLVLFVFIFYFLHQTIKKREGFYDTFIFLFKTSLVLLILTIGISAIKLFSVLEYKAYSIRDSLPLYGNAGYQWDSFSIDSLSKIFNPFPWNLNYIFNINRTIDLFFWLIVVFAFFKKSKELVFVLITSLIATWAGFSRHAFIDIYPLFYYFIPGFNTIELPIRFFIILNLTIPILLVQY